MTGHVWKQIELVSAWTELFSTQRFTFLTDCASQINFWEWGYFGHKSCFGLQILALGSHQEMLRQHAPFQSHSQKLMCKAVPQFLHNPKLKNPPPTHILLLTRHWHPKLEFKISIYCASTKTSLNMLLPKIQRITPGSRTTTPRWTRDKKLHFFWEREKVKNKYITRYWF